MTDERGPANDAATNRSETANGPNWMATGGSGEPAGSPIPDDGKSVDVNGADLLPGAQPALDTPTIAGDALGAAAGSELEEGSHAGQENVVGNQQ